jgi:hypothetical protein
MDRQGWVCLRLIDLGYAKNRDVRWYGKDLHLTSNPMADDGGYSIEGIERKSGRVRRTRIPLMVVRVVEQEAAAHEGLLAA